MKEIKLTQGKVALVDDEDFDFLNQWKWFVHKSSRSSHAFYAERAIRVDGKRVTILMHRVVMKVVDPNILIDHKNTNGLHNYKSNLRESTSAQNQQNCIPRKNTSSKYKGVSKRTKSDKWQVQIKVDKKIKHIGYFDHEDAAALAYNEAAKTHFGEFARLNIIE